jgi:uroporphyrinogen decarboxylase
VPLIGFSGSPWTLATYMVEGGASRDFARIKTLLYEHPDLLHHLLDVLATTVTDYLKAQITAGAQAVQIFDTWGGILTTPAYQAFSLAYCTRIISALKQTHPDVPIVLFTKGGGLWLEAIAGSGCDVVGLDWTQELREARRRLDDRVALQGNLDPAVLLASPEAIIDETMRLLQSYGHGSGHIFNLGHGITPQVPPEHVAILVETVQNASSAYHASRS